MIGRNAGRRDQRWRWPPWSVRLLLAQEIRWVTARAEGKMEAVLVMPGAPVQTESVLLALA